MTPPPSERTRSRPDGEPLTSRSDVRRLVVLFLLLAVPWSVVVVESGYLSLVFAWGLTTPSVGSVTTLYDFLFRFTAGLPGHIYAWPLSVALYGLALASAALGVVIGREDERVTAGLLVLAGVAQLSFAQGFSAQPGRFALPVGSVALWVVAWSLYWPIIRA
ncbi:MAG: TIGR04206 family protein [Halobacteriota archaeon]